MPEDDDGGRQWIVEPPGPGEISLHLAVGEGTALSNEQEAAVGALLRSLEARDPEVSGFAPGCPQYGTEHCTSWTRCGLSCTSVRCSELLCTLTGRLGASGSTEPWNLMGSITRA